MQPCVDGKNPNTGNICAAGTAQEAIGNLTQTHPTLLLFTNILMTTLEVAEKTQQLVKPLADLMSRPRNPWCMASAMGGSASAGGMMGLARGPGGFVTVPGGMLAGGTGGYVAGLGMCMSSSGPGTGGNGGGSTGGHRYSGKTVAEILKEKKGSIKFAELSKGSPP